MLEYLHLKNVGPAPEMEMEFAPRLNLIAGDNGLGKSFLLDVAWWALTRTWVGPVAQPLNGGAASIDYVVTGKTGRPHKVNSVYRREDGSWSLPPARPVMPG